MIVTNHIADVVENFVNGTIYTVTITAVLDPSNMKRYVIGGLNRFDSLTFSEPDVFTLDVCNFPKNPIPKEIEVTRENVKKCLEDLNDLFEKTYGKHHSHIDPELSIRYEMS